MTRGITLTAAMLHSGPTLATVRALLAEARRVRPGTGTLGPGFLPSGQNGLAWKIAGMGFAMASAPSSLSLGRGPIVGPVVCALLAVRRGGR